MAKKVTLIICILLFEQEYIHKDYDIRSLI